MDLRPVSSAHCQIFRRGPARPAPGQRRDLCNGARLSFGNGLARASAGGAVVTTAAVAPVKENRQWASAQHLIGWSLLIHAELPGGGVLKGDQRPPLPP